MGSPISFPVLCLFNAALTRYALEIASSANPRVYRLDELPMLINGDDLLCRTNPLEYLVWKDIVDFGGLTPSIGKNFRSRTIGTINSEMWHFSLTSQLLSNGERYLDFFQCEREQIIECGKIRGSMKGKASLASKADETSPFCDPQDWGTSAERRWKEFLISCPKPELAYDYLWTSVGAELALKLPSGVPLCQPVWLGGGGFPLPPIGHPKRDQREPSSSQRMIARYLFQNTHKPLARNFLASLNTTCIPMNLFNEMEEDNRIRRKLRVPKPTVDTPKRLDSDLTPLPSSSFALCGVEPNDCRNKNSAVLYSRVRANAWKCEKRPLSCAEFCDSPPSLNADTYVLQRVV